MFRNHQLPKNCLQGFGIDHLTRVRFIFATCCAQCFLGRAQISLRLIWSWSLCCACMLYIYTSRPFQNSSITSSSSWLLKAFKASLIQTFRLTYRCCFKLQTRWKWCCSWQILIPQTRERSTAPGPPWSTLVQWPDRSATPSLTQCPPFLLGSVSNTFFSPEMGPGLLSSKLEKCKRQCLNLFSWNYHWKIDHIDPRHPPPHSWSNFPALLCLNQVLFPSFCYCIAVLEYWSTPSNSPKLQKCKQQYAWTSLLNNITEKWPLHLNQRQHPTQASSLSSQLYQIPRNRLQIFR